MKILANTCTGENRLAGGCGLDVPHQLHATGRTPLCRTTLNDIYTHIHNNNTKPLRVSRRKHGSL